MNRTLIFIGGGVVLALAVILLALGMIPKNQVDQHTYTDAISGTTLTAFTETHQEGEHTHEADIPLTDVSISGLDDFYATINQDQGRAILTNLTSFIRARTGPGLARASVINSQVKQLGVDPEMYSFDMVVLNPYSKYTVTITIPESATTAATVTYQGVSQ